MDAKRRELVWLERQNFQGWACSECAWVFNPAGPPAGRSLDDMKQNFERQRNKEFTSHLCAEHRKPEKQSG